MIRKHVSISCFLFLAALSSAAAQRTSRPDTLVLGRGSLSGTWSATNGSAAFMGSWTAIPDTLRGSVIGTWTLSDAHGATLAFGGWSAAKSGARWTGVWRANVTGRAGEYSGTWTSSVDLKANARFAEMFESAAQTIVRGTWASGERSGGWSIRATERRAPD